MTLKLTTLQTNQLKSSLLLISVCGLVAVIVWAVVSISLALNQAPAKTDIADLLVPLDPTLDSQILVSYGQNRRSPPTNFKISVLPRDSRESTPQLLDPFTNQSEAFAPVATSSSNLFINQGE